MYFDPPYCRGQNVWDKNDRGVVLEERFAENFADF